MNELSNTPDGIPSERPPTVIGPPPPLDAEGAAALAAADPVLLQPVTPDSISNLRETARAQNIADEQLRVDGTYGFHEPTVPGSDLAPEVTLLVTAPTARPRSVPTIYYVHGGG